MTLDAYFEHIALVVHLDDLLAWDRFLRGPLGGTAAMGGIEPRAGFQGGQITYPEGGMLELITWTPGTEEKSANARYLARHGTRAALHHLTFLVDDFAGALAHCEDTGYEPLVGRQGKHWSEFFVKERALRPAGLLIQVLQADKDALVRQGWRTDWAPFTQTPEAASPVHIEGVHVACADRAAASRLLVALLGAEPSGDAFAFPGSSMKVWLDGDADAGHVLLSEPRTAAPEEAALFRASPKAPA